MMSGSNELLRELEALSNAAKLGDGQALLTSARAVAEISARFAQEVRTASQGCTNVGAKDELVLVPIQVHF